MLSSRVLPGICGCRYGDLSAIATGNVFKGHLCFFSYCQYLHILVKMLNFLVFKTLMGIDREIRYFSSDDLSLGNMSENPSMSCL